MVRTAYQPGPATDHYHATLGVDATPIAALGDPTDEIADAMADHEAAANPHATYETSAEVDAKVTTHSNDTTSVHGIADTSALDTTTARDAAITAHNAETEDVHGIDDTADLDTVTDRDAAIAAAIDALPVIVHGRVASDGTSSGSGFTSAKSGTGRYTITFTSAFASAPTVIATTSPDTPGEGNGQYAQVDGNATTTTEAHVWTINGPTGSATDSAFSFIAILG